MDAVASCRHVRGPGSVGRDMRHVALARSAGAAHIAIEQFTSEAKTTLIIKLFCRQAFDGGSLLLASR